MKLKKKSVNIGDVEVEKLNLAESELSLSLLINKRLISLK
jgi:hypothetical protein